MTIKITDCIHTVDALLHLKIAEGMRTEPEEFIEWDTDILTVAIHLAEFPNHIRFKNLYLFAGLYENEPELPSNMEVEEFQSDSLSIHKVPRNLVVKNNMYMIFRGNNEPTDDELSIIPSIMKERNVSYNNLMIQKGSSVYVFKQFSVPIDIIDLQVTV